MLEQPEIHLHPRLELRLADFLLGLAMAGKRVIVETHSDHVIDRLVRRILEDDSDKVASLVNILFVEPGTDGPSVRSVEIDPKEGIKNWPDGFFDQTAEEQEAIIKAGLAKRRNRRGNITNG